MEKKIRLLEDFPKVEHSHGKYYAYNSETGECAIFNDEKQLLFHDHFSPNGKLDLYPIHSNKLSFLNWEHDDLLPIGWSTITTNKPIKFGLYNIKTKSYVLPMNNYYIEYIGKILFFKTKNSLFIIDENGNLVGRLSNCQYFERDFYDFESKTVIVCKEFKGKYKYGVYSCKEKRMIIPIEFDKIHHKHVSGFIVTKNNQMGIYSYEGEVLTKLDCHYIEPICDQCDVKRGPISKTLVKISNLKDENLDISSVLEKHMHQYICNTGVFTLDHQCIIPMEFRAIYYNNDEFLIAQKYNLSWTVYSVSQRKTLVPPCIGVIINHFKKTIHATKYLELKGYSGHMEDVEGYSSYESRSCVTFKDVSSSKYVRPNYEYHICYDVYSTDGELIKQDVHDTLYSTKFCNPYLDSCISISHSETT